MLKSTIKMLNTAVFALQAENSNTGNARRPSDSEPNPSNTGNARRPSDSEPNPPDSKRQRVLVLNTSIISFIFFFCLLSYSPLTFSCVSLRNYCKTFVDLSI